MRRAAMLVIELLTLYLWFHEKTDTVHVTLRFNALTTTTTTTTNRPKAPANGTQRSSQLLTWMLVESTLPEIDI